MYRAYAEYEFGWKNKLNEKVYLKAKEIFTNDSDKISIDKLNRNFDVFKSGGPIGPLGFQGYPGVLGAQGSPGLQGVLGITGIQGVGGTTNTKWDMDKVIDPLGVDEERILRPLNLGQFSSRLILGENNTVFSNISPPTYEPQSLISFIKSSQSGGTGEMIEFPYIDDTGAIDSDFLIEYIDGDSGISQSGLSTPPVPAELIIKDHRNTPNGGRFKIEDLAYMEYASNTIQIIGDDFINLDTGTDLIFDSNKFINLEGVVSINVISQVNSYYKTAGLVNSQILINSNHDIEISSGGSIMNSSGVLLKSTDGNKILIEAVNINSFGNKVDFRFADTATINSNISKIDSSTLSSLNNTLNTGIIPISNKKFYINSSNIVSSQSVLFSDIDGNNTAGMTFDNIMSNWYNAVGGQMTPGDGILFKEGEDEDIGVDYAAPNFGTEEKDRTLADSFTYVSKLGENVEGGLLILKHSPLNMWESVYGIGQDVFNFQPKYELLNDWDVPTVINNNYYRYTDSTCKLSYIKIGNLINVQGFVTSSSSSGEHYGANINPPINTHNFMIPDDSSSLDDIIAIKISSPDKFPYVNSSSVPIFVDIAFNLVDSIFEKNSSTDEWGPFMSGVANIPTPSMDLNGVVGTKIGDNSGIVGVIPPGENKIFLYVEGWRTAWRSSTSQAGSTYGQQETDAVSMSKYPLTLRTLNKIKSDSQTQSMVMEADKFIFRYSFKMPADWNSYNKARGISDIQWGNTGFMNPNSGLKSVERGSNLLLKINYTGPSEYDWTYKIIRSKKTGNWHFYNLYNNSSYDINNIIDTANIVADKTSIQNDLTIPIKSSAAVDSRFKVIATNSYTSESIVAEFKIVIANANSGFTTGTASGGSTTTTTGSGAANTAKSTGG
tara:strand:- start:4750 stop:7419 length:2670 start_codon:yes stop_codon:yes gene_type:complete